MTELKINPKCTLQELYVFLKAVSKEEMEQFSEEKIQIINDALKDVIAENELIDIDAGDLFILMDMTQHLGEEQNGFLEVVAKIIEAGDAYRSIIKLDLKEGTFSLSEEYDYAGGKNG